MSLPTGETSATLLSASAVNGRRFVQDSGNRCWEVDLDGQVTADPQTLESRNRFVKAAYEDQVVLAHVKGAVQVHMRGCTVIAEVPTFRVNPERAIEHRFKAEDPADTQCGCLLRP